ncbi:MAG: tRNA (adenosine(37)-N6)-dimethylallyltransferase MiaA [Eubacterium sp.]|jgi:tRNA dimethylallyltransferase|nr:tRNA (adenosine(37)-N6)-dimethylallyltransferase MiaA [Eubacterium sp.]
MENIRIVVVCGPTASGKTALAVQIAEEFGGEVISADSMQVYKGMDIATAKPTEQETRGIPHHLISFVDPETAFSVADYVALAHKKIKDVHDRGRLPIIAGGTGLYISSLINNVKFDDTGADYKFREEMRNYAEAYGNKALLEKLRYIDPKTADKLHENNLSRIIRAIEVHKISGKKISEQQAISKLETSPYKPIMIGLNFLTRELLYERIEKRVEIMLNKGLLNEAESFLRRDRLPTCAQAIGYKELKPYFDRVSSLDECVENLKRSTRQYAKRQLTWFRREGRILWVSNDNTESDIKNFEKSKKIIKNCGNY